MISVFKTLSYAYFLHSKFWQVAIKKYCPQKCFSQKNARISRDSGANFSNLDSLLFQKNLPPFKSFDQVLVKYNKFLNNF